MTKTPFAHSLCAISLALVSTPALAGDGAQVPEASAGLLFAMGVLGVVIGRRFAKRPADSGKDGPNKP